MQGPAWLSLLRRLPAVLHEGMIIVTTNSAEIVVQSILRAERELLVIRGRMSGSQDTGRVIFVPFDQINYVGLTKKPHDAEIHAILAKAVPGGRPAEASSAATEGGDEGDAFIPEAAHVAEPPPPEPEPNVPAANGPMAPATPPKPAHPSKTVLLARLRARLAGEGSVKPVDAEKPG